MAWIALKRSVTLPLLVASQYDSRRDERWWNCWVSTRSLSRSRSSPCLTAPETLDFPSSKLAYNYIRHNVVLWVILLSVKLWLWTSPKSDYFLLLFDRLLYLFIFLLIVSNWLKFSFLSIHFGTSVENDIIIFFRSFVIKFLSFVSFLLNKPDRSKTKK